MKNRMLSHLIQYGSKEELLEVISEITSQLYKKGHEDGHTSGFQKGYDFRLNEENKQE